MDVQEEASKLFCHYVWVSLKDIDVIEMHAWLIQNMEEPFYRDEDAATDIQGKRWSLLKPITGSRNLGNLRVHFADPKDALLFKLRWG